MPAFHEHLHFDTANGQVLDDARRYVLLRADVLMGLFDFLPGPAREQALRAFGRSVAMRGQDSIRAYVAAAGIDALPALMEAAAASLGWGRWRLERVGVDGAAANGAPTAACAAGAASIRADSGSRSESLRLHVENSPFAAASRSRDPVCHAIAGMLEGLAGALWDAPAEARETRCAAAHGGGACTFIAVHSATADPAHRGDDATHDLAAPPA